MPSNSSATIGDLDTVYVPIGLGSGICGVIAMRDALGLATRIVGVVAENANAYAARSRRATWCPPTPPAPLPTAWRCGCPTRRALAVIRSGRRAHRRSVARTRSPQAIRLYFSATHALTEGAAAAPLAALMKERERMKGRRVGLIVTGQNIDSPVMAKVLAGETPQG